MANQILGDVDGGWTKNVFLFSMDVGIIDEIS